VTKSFSPKTLDPAAEPVAYASEQPRRRFPASALLLGIGAGVLLTLGAGRLIGGAGPAPAPEEPPAPAVAAQTVTAAAATLAPLADSLTVNGTVQAVDLLEVAPQVSGLQIRQVLVREGDRVVAGQVLATLDDATLQAQIRQQQAEISVAEASVVQRRAALAQAEASRREAQQDLARLQTLAERGAISQQDLNRQQTQALTAQESVGLAQAEVDSAQARVRSQQAALEQLQTQLTQTTLRAPAGGIVAARRATVGDVSSTSTPLFTLIQDGQLDLDGEVPQSQLQAVQVGATVTVTSSTDERIRLQGVVRTIDPVVDATTRLATVNISLPASDLLRPGMFLQGDILISSRQGLVIPATATQPQSDGQVRVYVVTPEGIATARSVTVGQRLPATADQPDRVEITAGLQPGETVVTTGVGYLQDGDQVTVVDAL